MLSFKLKKQTSKNVAEQPLKDPGASQKQKIVFRDNHGQNIWNKL